jgi:hypothetical protein
MVTTGRVLRLAPKLSERSEQVSYGRTSGYASAVCHLFAHKGQAGGGGVEAAPSPRERGEYSAVAPATL